jgi:hypothetical protein
LLFNFFSPFIYVFIIHVNFYPHSIFFCPFAKLFFLFNFTLQSNIEFILFFNFNPHYFCFYFFNPLVIEIFFNFIF